MDAIALPAWLGRVRPSGDVTLALGVVLLLAVLVVPLPALLLDAALAFSITVSVLVLMVALFLQRPARLHLLSPTSPAHHPAAPGAERRHHPHHPDPRP